MLINSILLLPSAERTAAQSVDIDNSGGHAAVNLVLNVTNIVATPGLTVSLFGVDAADVEYLLLAGTAVTTATQQRLQAGRGLPDTANASANVPLPRHLRVKVAVADADAATYSLAADLTA